MHSPTRPTGEDELERIARDDFGLHVIRRLPVTESFSSAVLSFIAADGRHYVVKRHWARNKAERDASALRSLVDHPQVPALLATAERAVAALGGRDLPVCRTASAR